MIRFDWKCIIYLTMGKPYQKQDKEEQCILDRYKGQTMINSLHLHNLLFT